jgi:putative ABC transport system permease protein
MSEVVSASTARRRFSVALVGAFGVLALALAAIGLYGVMSYHVAQRTHEFGIRAALGAARTDILRGVVFQGLRLSGAGVAGGLAIAVPAGRFIEAELYGIPASDAATLAASAGVLLGVALAASYLPARRAVNVDPAVALRSDT